MKRSSTCAAIYAAAALALTCASASREAFAQEPTFAGQTVSMIIGFAPGGGVDLFGRTLGKHLARHLPGNPTRVVQNQPGAGGVIALNAWLRRADQRGLDLTIGAQSQTDPDALIRTQARFDPAKFRMIGGLGAFSQGLVINKEAASRLTDKSLAPVTVGLVGSTLRGGSYQVLWGTSFLGWNVKWVLGSRSTGEVRQALDRGEIEMATFGATHDFDYLLKIGRFTVIAQTGQVQEGRRVKRAILGDAPIFSDMVRDKIVDDQARQAFGYWENVSQIGMWVALPPETPDAIFNAYARAFEAATKDPEFIREYARIDPDSILASRSQIEQQVGALAKVTPETLQYLNAELQRQGFTLN